MDKEIDLETQRVNTIKYLFHIEIETARNGWIVSYKMNDKMNYHFADDYPAPIPAQILCTTKQELKEAIDQSARDFAVHVFVKTFTDPIPVNR